MFNKLLEYKKTIAFLLGAISVCALPPYYIFPILFFSLSAFLFLLIKANKPKTAFAIGYWFGFGFFAVGLSWVGNALLIDAKAFGWLYPITLIAAGGFFGLFTAVPAWLTFYFKNAYAKFFAFSALWVLSEWIRSFILTGFPWNLLGSVLAFSPQTLQLASVIGTYGLSLLVLMICTAPALVINYHNKKSLIFSSITIIALSMLICVFGSWRLKHLPEEQDSNLTIRMVQPSIPQSMKWDYASLNDNFNDYIRLSKSEGLENVDFVIWGETASPFPLDMEPNYLNLITEAIPEKGYLITGLVRYEFDQKGNYQPLNSMFIINKDGKIVDYYDKFHLVPFGEYIPLRSFLPSWVRPITNTIANFKAGNGPKTFSLDSYPNFGALICYEVIFPAQIVNKHNRPNFIVNITNDGWYGISAGPYQHLVTAQLRAIEEGVAVIRVANSGISAAISKTGIIIASLPLNQVGYLDVKLPKNLNTTTVYGKFGNLVPLILSLANIIIALLIKRRYTLCLDS